MSTILTITAGTSGMERLPVDVLETFESAEVTQTDDGPSGFQLTFRVGKNKTSGLEDYQILVSSYFRVFNRVIITVNFDGENNVLIDGIITHHELNPSPQPGMSTMTITGEDLSVLMDLDEDALQYPDQSDPSIVRTILEKYSSYGITAKVTTPDSAHPPNKTDWVRSQVVTDRLYLKYLADHYAYDFYLVPGPSPGESTAYWGEAKRKGLKQNAISVNTKQGGNADQVNLSFNALSPQQMKGMVKARDTDKEQSLNVTESTVGNLSGKPALETNQRKRLRLLRDQPGLDYSQALAMAQSGVDNSTKDAVTATGQINGFRYRGVLQARGLVGLRGVGRSYDGDYYVKSVTHKLRRGEYTQSFVLKREGELSTSISVKV